MLGSQLGRADIVIAAIGKPQFVRGEWLKPGTVVIDVGINHVPGGSIRSPNNLLTDKILKMQRRSLANASSATSTSTLPRS